MLKVSQHAAEPWVTISVGATILYFGWYLVIVPVVGVIENSLSDLASDPGTDTHVAPSVAHS